MKSTQPGSLPLDYAAEITFELALMRDECVNAARVLVSQSPLNEAALDECARLDDALASAHRILQSALQSIRRERLEGGML